MPRRKPRNNARFSKAAAGSTRRSPRLRAQSVAAAPPSAAIDMGRPIDIDIPGPIDIDIPGTASNSGASSSQTSPDIPPAPYSFLNTLWSRQLGKAGFISEVLSAKVKNLCLVGKSVFHSHLKDKTYTLYCVRGGKTALVGLWYVQAPGIKFFTYIGEITFRQQGLRTNNISFISCDDYVLDVCQASADPSHVVYVSNKGGTRGIGVIELAQHPPLEPTGWDGAKFCNPHKLPFWCCAGNEVTARFAAGFDGGIISFNADGLAETRYVPGNSYGLEFNKMGTLMYSALDSGDMLVTDLRADKSSFISDIDDAELDEVKLLACENYCLVGGYSGLLCCVDLRMKRKLYEYRGHRRGNRRAAISVNEMFNVLCCSGGDNTVRFWRLNCSGLPIREIKISDSYPSQGCLYEDSHNCYAHIIQDNIVNIYGLNRKGE